MNDLLWLRVLAAFGVDASLAVLCGLLLARLWLGKIAIPRGNARISDVYGLRLFAALLLLAVCVQLLLLAVSFTGQTSFSIAMSAMRDVCSTHAGALLKALACVALLLCLATWTPPRHRQTGACGLLILAALCLHADTGHAASRGNLSLDQLLQLVHLSGMAVWSGAVLVSGLFIVPRLQVVASEKVAVYLDCLSRASTWAVASVILSGIVKAYIATGASVPLIRSTAWGQILMFKAFFVAITVGLGARNRWLLMSIRRQDSSSLQRVARTLRLEAVLMLVVLLLSAWLANSQPPLG